MAVNPKQLKTIDKLLSQFRFDEVTIKPQGENVDLHFVDGDKQLSVTLNQYGRKA